MSDAFCSSDWSWASAPAAPEELAEASAALRAALSSSIAAVAASGKIAG